MPSRNKEVSLQKVTDISADWTVNDTIARFPDAIAVLNTFGVDTCCGGGLSIAQAAQANGLDLDALLRAVREAVTAA